MLIAIDLKGNRILPEKGKIGTCQLCLNEVKAYCGEININHWRHTNLAQCDSWKENESDWHREWKNEFPKDWQEVIIEANNEKHIADIKTQNGLVLELQNSSISSSTIKIRENFYGKIIWLINANKFKDNFSIRSEVNVQLRYVDENYRNYYHNEDDSFQVQKIKEKKTNNEQKLREKEYQLSNCKREIINVENYFKEIIEKTTEYLKPKYYYSSVLEEFESKNKEIYNSLLEREITIKENLSNYKKNLEKITSLKKCTVIGYEAYRQINYENINPLSFEKCIMIEKETSTSLFPNIIKFKFKNEFEKTGRNKNYNLFVDASEKLANTELDILRSKNEIISIENDKKTIFEEISNEIILFLNEKNEKKNIEKIRINSKIEKLKLKIEKKIKSLEEVLVLENVEKEKFLIKQKNDYTAERFSIMKKYKGIYSYYWKHRRKSWDYSEKRIYLDFENHIFEILNESGLKKMSKNEFIEKVKNWI
jgi:competence CoiA-like predicted nuclease